MGRDSFSARTQVENMTGDVTHLSHEIPTVRTALVRRLRTCGQFADYGTLPRYPHLLSPQQSLKGRTVAIIWRFVRSIRGAYRGYCSYVLRRRRLVQCGPIMNATDVRPISPRYKLVFSNAVRLAAILCVLPGSATYPAALRAQEARTVTAPAAAAIAARPETPAAGARDADVTIIEFLDYNCPFCKKTAPELQKLLRADSSVRILYKEWPLFGAVSVYAARSALAANWQGKFLAAHNALISEPHDLDETTQVDSILKSVGVDLRRLADDRALHAADIDATLARNAADARGLGFRGTPGFLIGRQLVPRALTLQQLQQLIANARAAH